MSVQAISPAPVFSDAGAQDNRVVVREAQEWIQVMLCRSWLAQLCGIIVTTRLSSLICQPVYNYV